MSPSRIPRSTKASRDSGNSRPWTRSPPQTKVLINDGGTVVIGGVVVTNQNTTIDQVPLLGQRAADRQPVQAHHHQRVDSGAAVLRDAAHFAGLSLRKVQYRVTWEETSVSSLFLCDDQHNQPPETPSPRTAMLPAPARCSKRIFPTSITCADFPAIRAHCWSMPRLPRCSPMAGSRFKPRKRLAASACTFTKVRCWKRLATTCGGRKRRTVAVAPSRLTSGGLEGAEEGRRRQS